MTCAACHVTSRHVSVGWLVTSRQAGVGLAIRQASKCVVSWKIVEVNRIELNCRIEEFANVLLSININIRVVALCIIWKQQVIY